MARGSVTKRKGKSGDSWRIAVELQPDPLTGHRRQRFESFMGSKRDADKRLRELLTLADQGRLGVTSKATLAEFLATWLRDYASTKAPKTFVTYGEMVHRHVVPRLGNVRLDKLTPAHFVALLTALRETPRADGKGTLSPASVSAVYRMMRTALNVAVKWQVLSRSPLDGVDAPRVPRKEMKTFNVDEAQRFLAASADEGLRWQALFTLALYTGARPGELRALRWEDVDLTAGTMAIQRHAQRLPGQGVVTGPTKTGSGRRPIILGSDVVALLRKHRAAQNEHRLTMGPLWRDNGLVFASEVGTFVEQKAEVEAFRRICQRAGVPIIRVYDLRHTSASLLLASGVHPKVVAERLGHANVTLTLTTYSHVLPGLQRDAAETLEAALRVAK